MQSQVTTNTSFINQTNFTFLSLLSVDFTEKSAIAQGISDLIDEINVKNDIDFDFHILNLMIPVFDSSFKNKIDRSSPASNVLNDILSKNKGNYVCEVNLTAYPKEIKKSAVLLISNAVELQMILQVEKYEDFNLISPAVSTILMYSDEITTGNFNLEQVNRYVPVQTNIKDKLSIFFLINTPTGFQLMANVIKKHDTSIGIYFVYEYEVINQFDKTTLKWSENFDKLSIKNRTTAFKNYFLNANFESGLKYECYIDEFDGSPKGVFIDLFDIVSQRGQFKMLYQFGNFNNPSAALGDALHKVPFFVNFFSSSLFKLILENPNSKVFLTTTYSEEQFKFVITPPDSYTSYEKLLMPFDKTTWIFLMITFLCAFITILYINRLSRNAQNLIYGENVKMPGYNVVSIFFGMGQTQLPVANVPRFILMLFIMFCLIFRTGYQGILYELITTDVHKESPATVLELVELNYTFNYVNSPRNTIMLHHFQRMMNENKMNLANINMRQLTNNNFNDIFLETYQNSSEKVAFFADENNLIILNDLCHCENLLLDQVLFRYPMGIEVKQNTHAFDILEETLQLIIPFGIPQHSVNIHKWKWLYKFDPEQKQPQVFSLESLSFGFVLWLGACGMSFLWFLFEFLQLWLKKQSKILIGLILFLLLLNSRVKTPTCL